MIMGYTTPKERAIQEVRELLHKACTELLAILNEKEDPFKEEYTNTLSEAVIKLIEIKKKI